MKRWLALALISSAALVACGGEALEPAHRAKYCYAPQSVVHDYLQRISDLASNKARTDVLWRREQAFVSFLLAPDGSASDFRVARAPRPEVGQVALDAVIAAAPYPRPPFDPSACFFGGRAEIGIVSFGRCDSALGDRYTRAVAAKIQDAVNAAGLYAPAERAQVALRIKVSREGAATIAVHDAPSEKSGVQVAAIARKLSPFEAPDDAIRECIADQSFFVWIGLPGETRGPVRISD